MLTGQVAAPAAALSPISVPLAELFNVALAYERAGRLADAERLLGHVLAAAPTQADALHLACIVAYRLGRKSDALDLTLRLVLHGVNTPLYWRNIGEVLRVHGRLDEALAAGRRVVTLNPDDPVTLANLAVIHNQAPGVRPGRSLRARGAGARSRPSRRAFRPCRRAVSTRRFRARLGGVRVALPTGRRRKSAAWRGRQWRGRPLQGRLLVIADQGSGDTIRFGL